METSSTSPKPKKHSDVEGGGILSLRLDVGLGNLLPQCCWSRWLCPGRQRTCSSHPCLVLVLCEEVDLVRDLGRVS